MAYAPINGLELYYEEAGQGPPIVLGHGGWSDITEWEPQVVPLSPRFRVIRYDRRGCGRSRPKDVEQHPDLWVEDLRQLILYLGLDKPYLGGVSFGGMQLVEFLVRYPDMVKGAVIVSATAQGFQGRAGRYQPQFPNRLAELKQVTVPTLVVQATQDEVFPPAHGEAIAAAMPNARLVVLEGGHTINNLNAPEFNRVLLEWLEEMEAASP